MNDQLKKKKILVTGGAGFIGSHLIERLIKEGFEVTGIDCFTDYYSRDLKKRNLSFLVDNKLFNFIEANLLNINLDNILENIDYVFHLAAQPGVRGSWGENFKVYMDNNILATQKILESVKEKGIKKFIYASSSSIYGDPEDLPTKEESIPKPVSPYGVTKLAGENLCYLYWKNYQVPVVSLRYFTVYGPRQRPDMAFYKFIKSILQGHEIIIYGDGKQTRDFTFISDIIEGNILAMNSKQEGDVFNISGGTRIEIMQVIKLLEKIIGKKAKLKFTDSQKGDAKHTFSDISKGKKELGYYPRVKLEDGLKEEVEWVKRDVPV